MATTGKDKPKFKRGIGEWVGTAEVYDGQGRFVGNALDRRSVQQLDDDRIQINLNFVGPLMLSGHYIIENRDGYRLYQGPANVGYAEAFGEGLVEAHNYWSQWGLSQRFFLYVTEQKDMQLSLALLSRGEQLQYVVIGEYKHVEVDAPTTEGFTPLPEALTLAGTPHDKSNDPNAGRSELLLHRQGMWEGQVQILDGNGNHLERAAYSQSTMVTDTDIQRIVRGGGIVQTPFTVNLLSNGWQAWTKAGDVVGSYNLIGGRALSGQFHHLPDERRVWMREVVTGDGSQKVILHIFYRGSERVGVQYGLLTFTGNAEGG